MQGIWISEKILHEQICTMCKKYLSHGPIKITTKEGIKCGRCSTESDIGVISCVNSVFGSVIFPCVNRYEGCSQLLNFQDVPKHEETCIGKQYSCPLCPETQYSSNSLLALLSHYRHFHKSEIIWEPCIIVDMKVHKEHIYLYCNDLESMVIFIRVKFNGNVLSITPSTIIEDANKVKYNVSLVEDGCQKYSSPGEVCGVYGLNVDSLEVDLETLSLKKSTTCVYCIFNFEVFNALKLISLPSTKHNAICIEDYGHSKNNFIHPTYPKKLPDIYLSNSIRNSYGIIKRKNCGEYYTFISSLNIPCRAICDLCENYFATSANTAIFTCLNTFICGGCSNGLTNSEVVSNCSSADFVRSGKLLYYCRYGCKKFFKMGQLWVHETRCYLNTEERLDDETFGALHFGNYFCISSGDCQSVVLRSSLVICTDLEPILDPKYSNGRIYMVTECFKCILFYEKNEFYVRFRAEHQYCPNQYYIQFKVVKHGILPAKEEVNSFSIHLDLDENNLENLIENNDFFFCIFLRKIESVTM